MGVPDDNRLVEMTRRLRAGGQTAIAPYLTAGDGGLERTLELLFAAERAGAACIELGVPFSDPIADGPILQAAALRGLEAGASLDLIEAMVIEFRRRGGEVPILAFSYLNPLLGGSTSLGLTGRMDSLAGAGFDGLLIPDLPLEEAPVVSDAAAERGLATVLFAAPTTSDERVARAAEATGGFLYVLGRTGVTGRATTMTTTSDDYLARVRRLAGDVPLGVGFGIKTRAQVEAVGQHAELAIVGSALVQSIHEAATGAADPISAAAERAEAFLLGLQAPASQGDAVPCDLT